MPYFIDVILPLPLQKRFTYAISEAEANFLEEGMRVAVPFGKSKVYTAITAAIHQNPPQVYEAKPINQILDKNPLVTKHQLKFWAWIASYYMCAEGDVLKAALPGAFLLESESIVELAKGANVEEVELEDEEYLVIEALQRQSSVKIQEVMKILDKKTVLPFINALVQKGLVVLNQEIYEQYKPKKIRFVRLNPEYDNEAEMHQLLDELEKAPKQKEALLSFFSIKAQHKKPLKVKDLSDKSGVSAAIIKSLIKKEILEEFYEKTDRVTFSGESSQTEIQLSEIQHKAFSEIEAGLKEQDVCLFHGITSSGKTEIYIKLIEKVIENGQQALYVLPEIALTTQLIERLRAYFGDKVLVYHSKYSVNERVEVYRHILEDSEKARIVIGARSSIFLPFANLGLVVVDEEHETSFKQFDPAPRYHARDAAVVLANLFKTKTILGSATPSLESYFNAKHHKYAFVELNRRYGDVLEPEIEIVDIKTKYKKKEMKGHFSNKMLAEIRDTLDVGEQVILFQNRRGFSPVLECNTCGHSPQCPNCDVSLTFHSHNNQLRCHYCGYHIAMQKKCMACDSPEITTKGFGTEQIETELKAIFPDYKTARMDQDTTRGKYAYEKLITSFEQQEIDILIGTQMLTKGLDFRKVNLVGIMNADNLLNFPDFRAHERSFQLMLQVAGRAGRTKKRGKVLIQSYNPHHQIIQQVSMGDYAGMYKDQLEERYNYKYPPFYRLIRITLKCRDYSKTNDGADWLAAGMKNVFKENVLGPEFPPVARIRNEYYKNILLKIPQQQSLGKTKKILQRIMESFKAIGAFRSIKVVINVDPI
ncbi:replication restart helicase PriA [Salegentibacter salarius]|uniref:Replication restart protein PriA n=1 Tax=Salegentibacter salarius TaxID=435906 RepID=A0A2N0U180_9FLAO|nr:primosomal protein N' [Salegentibacter salarius]OEY73587.1 primosomal protein N' [Salegentibacter salarius]PKD20757.1 primosomal protein N' [Salegentibacter salarius]SLJ95422.1 replication restart DNA helicase PriA [Salegentibacter salarius]